MTIKELHESPMFKLLDAKEKEWVDEYCATADPDKATQKVFEPATDRALKFHTRKMMTEPRIVPILALWNGELEAEPNIDQYRRELWRMARECHSDAARAALMRLYGEARGFIKRSNLPPDGPKVDLGVLQEIEQGK